MPKLPYLSCKTKSEGLMKHAMTIGSTQFWWLPKIWAVIKLRSYSVTRPEPLPIGWSDLKEKGFPGSPTQTDLEGQASWIKSKYSRSKRHCVHILHSMILQAIYGMANCSHISLINSLAFNLGYDSASACFANSAFDCENQGLWLQRPIPKCSKALKKIAEYATDDNIDLWSLDEVHFQQHGSRCRMWVPPECKDPIVLHHPTRKSVGYFGAMRLRDGKLLHKRETNTFNAETYWSFMKKLRQISSHAGRRVLVLADNARYHHAKLHSQWRKNCSDKFAHLFLPPYSPELNPIERVWKLTRRMATHNRYFEKIEHVADAVEVQFNLWSKPNNTLKRLCAII